MKGVCAMLKERVADQSIRPRFMRPKQAASYLAICEASLWRLVQRGELPGLSNGGRAALSLKLHGWTPMLTGWPAVRGRHESR